MSREKKGSENSVNAEKPKIPNKPLSEVEVGDTLTGNLLGWRFVIPVPDVAALEWINSIAPDAVIHRRGLTLQEIPSKEFEENLTVVIASVPNLDDIGKTERLFGIRKQQGVFVLRMSPPRKRQ